MSAVPAGSRTEPRRRFTVPPNVFAIAFGLSGFAGVWHAAGPVLGTPSGVPNALFILTAAVWLVLVAGYAAQRPARLRADLRDPVLAPYLSLPAIVGMTLGAALATAAFTAGQIFVVIFLVIAVAFGGWLMGQWVVEGLDHDHMHPGYYLPTVAAGSVGAVAANEVHLYGAADAIFGIGVISWLLLGTMVLSRLFFHPALPPALVPTLAIETAAPAVTGVAYFALAHGKINIIAYALGGYTVLMVVLQLRFIPLYARLRFSIGTWSFTFSYSIAAAYALDWITLTKVADATAYAAATVALITVLVGAVGVRTVVAIMRGQLLPTAAPEIPAQKRPQPSTPARQRQHQRLGSLVHSTS
jgi:tellurite resistance protein